MLRQLVITALMLSAQLAFAAEAGKIIFVAGKADVANRAASLNAAVQEGDTLTTGSDGFIYVKTIDNGLFILRPNTKARIATYHVDAKDPANTRIKLELMSGVARSLSGEAVKLARQNFRFNTPVAAIGVRGTDFTVFTDQDTSRVAVISGGIVMSGFVGACRPEGTGPCEGNASRELSAVQRGQLLQVRRGQNAPMLLQSGGVSPDQVSPPRSDEPLGKAGAGNGGSTISAEPNLDAKKSESLIAAQQPTPVPPVLTPPPVVAIGTPPPVVQLPERQLVWGRWQPLLDQAAKVDLAAEIAKSELVAINGNYALFSTPGQAYVSADRGNVSFTLKNSEAYIYTDNWWGRVVTPAALQNGQLAVDFGTKTFTTSLDLVSTGELFKLQSQGAVTANGRLYGDASNGRAGVMNLQGALSTEKGGSAAYIFDSRLDALRTVNGVTYWGH